MLAMFVSPLKYNTKFYIVCVQNEICAKCLYPEKNNFGARGRDGVLDSEIFQYVNIVVRVDVCRIISKIIDFMVGPNLQTFVFFRIFSFLNIFILCFPFQTCTNEYL